MKLKVLIREFERVVPLSLQEEWDKSGLNLGDAERNVTGVLFSYDVCLEAVRAAVRSRCQLIVSHHPFRLRAGVKVDLNSYEGRIIAACVKGDVALYSVHTNHDASPFGMNRYYMRKLRLGNVRPLSLSAEALYKLAVFTPQTHVAPVMDALFAAGAGGIGNYSECSFRTAGTGTFKGNDLSRPALGKKNRRESVLEDRVEVLVPQHRLTDVLGAMKRAHPYEEIAHDIVRLENRRQDTGLGAVGEWSKPRPRETVLRELKRLFGIRHLRFVASPKKSYRKIGICTGSGTSLMPRALAEGCDLFITGDVKYHQAIDAKRADLALADVGHFASEVRSVLRLKEIFSDVFGKSLKLKHYDRLRDAFEIR